MLRELFIVGAGGFGRELYAWLRDMPECGRDWKFAGFLDDKLSALDGFKYDAGVVARVDTFEPRAGQLFACGIGNVQAKIAVCQPLIERGAQFLTIVHPTAILGENVALGEGVVLCPRVTLSCDIKLGPMTMLNYHVTVGHDARVGSWTTLCPHCDLTGGTQVGDRTFLGSGARLIPGTRVGDDALVGAGAVVMRTVKDGQRVFGNPARVFTS